MLQNPRCRHICTCFVPASELCPSAEEALHVPPGCHQHCSHDGPKAATLQPPANLSRISKPYQETHIKQGRASFASRRELSDSWRGKRSAGTDQMPSAALPLDLLLPSCGLVRVSRSWPLSTTWGSSISRSFSLHQQTVGTLQQQTVGTLPDGMLLHVQRVDLSCKVGPVHYLGQQHLPQLQPAVADSAYSACCYALGLADAASATTGLPQSTNWGSVSCSFSLQYLSGCAEGMLCCDSWPICHSGQQHYAQTGLASQVALVLHCGLCAIGPAEEHIMKPCL